MNELPEKPEGFTRRMTMHLNFGEQGGAATFEVFYPNGDKAEFLAKGGKAREVTGYTPQKPYMSVRDQNKASWLRTQAGKGEE